MCGVLIFILVIYSPLGYQFGKIVVLLYFVIQHISINILKHINMLWNNSKNNWKSSVMVMELCFDYAFDLTFDDSQSENYVIRFYKSSLDSPPKSLGDQVISLN